MKNSIEAQCLTQVEPSIERSGIRTKPKAKSFNESDTQLVANPVEREMLLIRSLLRSTSELSDSDEVLRYFSIL